MSELTLSILGSSKSYQANDFAAPINPPTIAAFLLVSPPLEMISLMATSQNLIFLRQYKLHRKETLIYFMGLQSGLGISSVSSGASITFSIQSLIVDNPVIFDLLSLSILITSYATVAVFPLISCYRPIQYIQQTSTTSSLD